MSELLFHDNDLVSSEGHLSYDWIDPSSDLGGNDNSAHGSHGKWTGSGPSESYGHSFVKEAECCPLVVDYIDFLVILMSIAGATALLWLTMNNCCFRDPTTCVDSTNCPAIMGKRRKRSSTYQPLEGKMKHVFSPYSSLFY